MAEEFVAALQDGFEYETCDLELLELILRGEIGGHSRPLAQLTYVDDNGIDVDISEDIKKIGVVQRRDDRRTDIALLAPPTATLRVSLFNVDKRYTTGAGGQFDGVIKLGRVLKVQVGYIVGSIRCFFPQGEYILDDPSFNVDPGAEATIIARDKLSLALDRKISMRSFVGGADEYIIEVLEKIGIPVAETIIPNTTVSGDPIISFGSTPIFTNKSAIEILSDVLIRMQTQEPFRLLQIDDKVRLVEIPRTGLANRVFHWKREMIQPFSRKERSNQARSVTIIKTVNTPSVTADVDLNPGGDSGDETDLPQTIVFAKAIRIEHRAGAGDTLPTKETARTTTSVTIDRVDPSGVGSWSIAIRGDTTAEVVGEAGPGIDQGGAGLGMKDASGNEVNTLLLRRGRTFEQLNGFVVDSTEAQDLANIMQTEFGPPVREVRFSLAFANPNIRINDLFRIVEKYSADFSIFHVGEIKILYVAGRRPKLTGGFIGQFANIVEIAQAYDKAFQYNQGRIYDERFGIGDIEDQDLSLRGAIVTRTRP